MNRHNAHKGNGSAVFGKNACSSKCSKESDEFMKPGKDENGGDEKDSAKPSESSSSKESPSNTSSSTSAESSSAKTAAESADESPSLEKHGGWLDPLPKKSSANNDMEDKKEKANNEEGNKDEEEEEEPSSKETTRTERLSEGTKGNKEEEKVRRRRKPRKERQNKKLPRRFYMGTDEGGTCCRHCCCCCCHDAPFRPFRKTARSYSRIRRPNAFNSSFHKMHGKSKDMAKQFKWNRHYYYEDDYSNEHSAEDYSRSGERAASKKKQKVRRTGRDRNFNILKNRIKDDSEE